MSQRFKWVNLVTEEASAEEPKEAKGAILADDVCHLFLSCDIWKFRIVFY
jgi:hypothetical protein